MGESGDPPPDESPAALRLRLQGLAERCLNGDQRACAALTDELQAILRRIIRGNAERAKIEDELMSECLWDVWKPGVRKVLAEGSKDNVVGYLAVIVMNAFKRLRKTRLIGGKPVIALVAEVATPIRQPAEELAAAEALERFAKRLTPEEAALLRCLVEGMKRQDIPGHLGWTDHKYRCTLQSLKDKYGGEP